MRRKFLSNLIFLLFLNLLIKPFWILAIDRGVQNALGAESYGFYFAILNFSFLFNIILDIGITSFNNRNIAQHNQLISKYLPNILILKLLLAIVYFVIIFITGIVIGYNSKQLTILILLGLNQFLLSFILYLRSNISGLLKFKTDSILSVLDRLIVIFIMSILLWGNISSKPLQIEWYVLAQTFAYIITAFIAIVIVLKHSVFLSLKWNKPFILMIIRQTYPFAILILLMTFYNRIDSVMIERILPTNEANREVGIYASGYRLLDAVNTIAYLFAGLLMPLFAKMIKEKQSLEKLIKLSFTLLLFISISTAIVSFFYAIPIMQHLYKEHQLESARVFKLLMLCFIPISITYIFGTLLTANGNLKYLNITALIAIAINLILNFILIPMYKSQGAAIASICTQVFMALTQLIIAYKVFNFKVKVLYIFRIIIFITLSILIGYFSVNITQNWIYNFVVLCFALCAIAFTLSLFSLKSFFNILKNG